MDVWDSRQARTHFDQPFVTGALFFCSFSPTEILPAQIRSLCRRFFLLPFIGICLFCARLTKLICSFLKNFVSTRLLKRIARLFAGTYPKGDIILEYGNPLRILCILDQSFVDKSKPRKNSSDLLFVRNNKEMEQEFIQIINETTIQLDFKLPPPSDDMYYCKLRLDTVHGKELQAVCLNKVVVGCKYRRPVFVGYVYLFILFISFCSWYIHLCLLCAFLYVRFMLCYLYIDHLLNFTWSNARFCPLC